MNLAVRFRTMFVQESRRSRDSEVPKGRPGEPLPSLDDPAQRTVVQAFQPARPPPSPQTRRLESPRHAGVRPESPRHVGVSLAPTLGTLALVLFQSLEVFGAGVEFPGARLGAARVAEANGVFTLQNEVIAASWRLSGTTLRPAGLADKLGGASVDQSGAELFRIATKDVAEMSDAVFVGVRLETEKVVAVASRDGAAWLELASFPRTNFPGEPKLVRIGKMNLKAQAKDHSDKGAVGESVISELSPAPASLPTNRFAMKTGGNQAAVLEFAFPAGTKFVSCRIDRGTDQGMSWSPALALVWEDGTKFLLLGLRDKSPTFNITTAAGETVKGTRLPEYPAFDLPASSFKLAAPPRVVRLAADARGVRVAEKFGGAAIEADLVSDSGIRARWRAELRDDSNYIRTTLDVSAAKPVPVYGVELADVRVANARTVGTVPGCPVTSGNFFFGVEMPGAQNAVSGAGARIGFGCKLGLSAQPYSFGAVAGVAAAGQMRRSFLHYMERERARPSKPFLHYNCWYDLGYGVDEKGLLDVVQQFDAELVKKRGVPVLSYLADDGWDSPNKGLWVENTNRFPQGFAGLNEKLKQYDAHLAIWISPLGGYGGDKERTAWAQKMGLIPTNTALDLAQPAYKEWFQNRCLELMRDAGVNAFKWDKAGQGVSPHFMALLDVARNLRRQNPEVFINVTVGTWPSPFWLNHIDSTWRDGSSDVGWHGKSSDPANEKYNRERWLTFRDGYCRKLYVEASPLYPLNSVMHHGIVHGRDFQGGSMGKTNPADLKNEARSYFANGASLQELYLTPSMMTSNAWDQVAEAAKWGHANADVLADAHWVGGDPLKGEAYGYAAWNPRKGTLLLRNPDDKPQTIMLDAAKAFELPESAPKKYSLVPAYKDQRTIPTTTLRSGFEQTITLEPFEVLVFDAEARP